MAVLNPLKVEARFRAIEERLDKMENGKPADAPPVLPTPAPAAPGEAEAADDDGDEEEKDPDDEDDKPLTASRGKSQAPKKRRKADAPRGTSGGSKKK